MSLRELARAAGSSPSGVAAELDGFGLEVVTDWCGHQAVTEETARRWMAERERRKAEREAVEASYFEQAVEWVSARSRAVTEAADAAERALIEREPDVMHREPPYKDYRQAGAPVIVSRSRRCQDVREAAAREAGVEFERAHRRPRDVNGQLYNPKPVRGRGRVKLALRYISADEEPAAGRKERKVTR